MKIIKEHYLNGQLKEKYTINKNGQKHGIYKYWYSNRQLWEKSTYSNGQLYGLHETWYTNGKLWAKSNFKNDKLHGLHETWYANGELREKAYYIDNEKVTEKEWEEYTTNNN